MAVAVPLLMLLAAASPPRLLAARGGWAAFDRGSHCEAVARSELLPPKGQAQPALSLSFDRSGRRVGEVAVRFKRALRPGSTALLTIGDTPFLLVTHGAVAWSSGPAQEAAILAALRTAGAARVEARDSAGRRMTDRYLLAGAPTAIDAAAAACARPR